MFELQKPKLKSKRPTPPPSKTQSKAMDISHSEQVESTLVPTDNVQLSLRQEKELDWDDDGIDFDTVSNLIPDTISPVKPSSPPRTIKSAIQLDTQELEFVTDEQLLKSARTFHATPSKENKTENKDEHLRMFWFDAYEDSNAQPGKNKIKL